ncbi:MAG TPA: PIN domain nuclease [Nitrospirae bacterium]|nr:PIN domain nuclease [Nitrospirota bacterium]HDL20811.1 PIN domain nuclease [Nitrospirota bacterium]HDZ01471.1 PIN domain nuclease [Nitrospirota bacterium]
MILVDTSVWINFLNGRNTKSRRILHALLEDEAEICLSEIILMEILQGIRDDNQLAGIKDYLLAFPVLINTPVQSYIHASDIYRRCRKKGFTVRKPVDCLISAVALENDAMLFHNDSDFEKIAKVSDLRLYK